MASRKRQATSEQRSSKKIKTETHVPEEGCVRGDEKNNNSDVNVKGFLAGINVYILPAGIEKTRLQIFKSQIVKNGGHVQEKFDLDSKLTNIIVDDKMDVLRMLRLMQVDDLPDIPVVKSAWLSLCLKMKNIVPFEDFQLQNILSPSVEKNVKVNDTKEAAFKLSLSFSSENYSPAKAGQIWQTHDKLKMTVSGSDSDENSKDDNDFCKLVASGAAASSFNAQKQIPIEKWICAQSSKNPTPNFNRQITDKLEEMVKNYESTKDTWRAFGYQKAIQALRRYPKEITSWEEAKALPNVGKRLADKIWEIAQSGELRKLREFEENEQVTVLKLFNNVWGAGPHTAQVWYQQGFRTIADLKEKASLTHQQEVGVRLYDDLLERMPREEAGEIEKFVREAAESIQNGIIAHACGSYRRGKATCGDVDVLVTHPDGKSHIGIFHKLLANLKESGFLTDDLVSVEETGNQKKYLGVCKLAGENRKHRRLDIIVVPYKEYACALVYFTGSAHFNRSLRHLCKKQNMSLNEHALKKGVIRKGSEKIFEGIVIPTPTEESVFQVLKIPFRLPEERDH